MIIRKIRKLKCRRCGQTITLRSYDGLAEDAWYIDAKETTCPKGKRVTWHYLRVKR